MIARHIGVLGGTFDPIHFGHLRTGLELLELLRLDRMLFIPAGTPPHRGTPDADPAHRLRMLQLALRGESRLLADGRECARAGRSYTVETLRELREEWGPSTAISLCIGLDAFLGIHRWRCYDQLLELVHIVVMARPGWRLPDDLGVLHAWRHHIASDSDTLWQRSAGGIVFVSTTPVELSATRIREIIAGGRSARFMLPDSVWRYIHRYSLYGSLNLGKAVE